MIEGVFRWVLEEVTCAGYLSPEVVFVDGTHIKANANLKKHVQKQIPIAAKRYQEQLDEEIEADRSAHGKKPLKKDDDDDDPPKEKRVIESTTDPESGVFHKGEHKSALHMKRIPSVISAATCWKRRSRPVMSTTASRLTRYSND